MAMADRGFRRGAGTPFYAPPKRKTSAEIISEARAAIFDDMSGPSSGSSGVGALRPLRTRRPFTPREPQRTLFNERTRKRDPRPPSAFDLKYLSLSEDNEEPIQSTTIHIAGFGEEYSSGINLTENKPMNKKDNTVRNQVRPALERPDDGITWSSFTKLPHLSGKSKPLHRRNTTGQINVNGSPVSALSKTISVSKAFDLNNEVVNIKTYSNELHGSKSIGTDASVIKRRAFGCVKSVSYDSASGVGDIPVRHLALQLPNTSLDNYESMSTLELAEALATQGSHDVERILLIMEPLQNILEKTTPSNNLRELVLRSLYSHVDNEDERVLVCIARAMLTMRVTGKHLSAACKLVFKIARNDKNDHFFKNSNLLELLVEGCGRADPLAESESCVYGAGALRFLALEPRLCALAHQAGALHLAALHLKILNNAKAERPRQVQEQATHALYQLTGALRNLASSGSTTATTFVSSGALAELLAALPLHTDRDVLTNVARCLSVLSAEEPCCDWLCASSSSAHALLRALAACGSRAPLAVRLAYTLGNMAAADDQARINIYNEEGGVDVLLTILESYTKRNMRDSKEPESDPDLHLIGSDLGGSDGSNEDVLIKKTSKKVPLQRLFVPLNSSVQTLLCSGLKSAVAIQITGTVRVVANLCLSELAGRGLAVHHPQRTVKALLACLYVADRSADKQVFKTEGIQRDSCEERQEELATAALATLNNVTFYLEPTEPDNPLDDILEQICKATCHWLRRDGYGATVTGCEAVRALGNLSRSTRAAQYLVLEGALDVLPAFLEHVDASVRYAAAGVLVNVCGCDAGAHASGAAAAAALRAAADARDTPAAALLARALWNAHAHRPLDSAHAHLIAEALAAFINDDSVFTACTAPRSGDCVPIDSEISKHHHVKFEIDQGSIETVKIDEPKTPFVKAVNIDENMHNGYGDEDFDRPGNSGEDLGFEEGDITGEDECDCEPCRRLAAWDELVGVAIPLLEKLRPPRADASVGTE